MPKLTNLSGIVPHFDTAGAKQAATGTRLSYTNVVAFVGPAREAVMPTNRPEICMDVTAGSGSTTATISKLCADAFNKTSFNTMFQRHSCKHILVQPSFLSDSSAHVKLSKSSSSKASGPKYVQFWLDLHVRQLYE